MLRSLFKVACLLLIFPTVAKALDQVTVVNSPVVRISTSSAIPISSTTTLTVSGSGSFTVTPGTGSWAISNSTFSVVNSTVGAVQVGAWSIANTTFSIVNSTIGVTDAGGSLTVDGTVSVNGSTMSVMNVSGGNLSVTFPSAQAVTQSGSWTITNTTVGVTDSGGSLTVDNAGTFPVQAAQSGNWQITNTTFSVVNSTGGAVQVGNWSIVNSTLGVTDAGGSLTVDNAGVFVVQAAQSGAFIVTQTTIGVMDAGGSLTVDGNVGVVNSTIAVVGLSGGAISVISTSTIVVGSTVGVVASQTLTKGTQATTGFSTQDLKDAGRTLYVWTTTFTVTAASSMTLVNQNKSSVITSTTSFSVTAAKTLRLQGLYCAYRATSATTSSVAVRIHWASSGAVNSGSSVLDMGFLTPPPGTLAANQGSDEFAHPFPDGIEITSGQIGFEIQGTAAQGTVSFCLIGYEY